MKYFDVGLILKTYRDGLSLFQLAIGTALIAFVPELIQHAWEINADMFASKEALAVVSKDPERLWWAMPKITGLILACAAATRFWAVQGSTLRWWNMKGWDWAPALLSLIAPFLLVIPLVWFRGSFDPKTLLIALAVLLIATMPLLPWQVAKLVGDKQYNLMRAFREGWGASNRMGLLTITAILPAMALHYANHYWAIGQPLAMVWGIMIFDSVVVAALPLLLGTAMYLGFKASK